MSSRFRWLNKAVMVAAVPALILAIVYLLPPTIAASTSHSRPTPAPVAPAEPAPVALAALPAMPALAAPPAPPEPPDPPDAPTPRAYHRHGHDDGEGAADRAWLGVTLSEIDEEGARVANVAEDSPAAEAGLEEGDRIIGIEGKKVISSRDVVRAVRTASPGDKISIRILRRGDEKTLTATLAGRRISDRHEFRFVNPEGEDLEIDLSDLDALKELHGGPGHHMTFMTAPSRTWLGVELLSMSSDLREALKAPSDKGLLINRVVEDSPAKSAGLRAGDVIIAVGGKDVGEIGDIGEALADRNAGDSVEVTVVRDGSERTIDVKLDDRPSRGRRSFYVPGGIDSEARIAIDKAVREAMASAREALRTSNEQLRTERDRIRIEQNQIRDQIQQQMRELKEQLRDNPPAIIRARTIHDI